MNFIKKSIFIILVSFFFSFSAKAEVSVVTTIKPLHSLVSSVMKGVGEPSLIIEGTNNPHTFVFKPSHAEMIENADIVFWIGEDLEAFMEKPLDSLAKNAKTISFMDLASIEKLKFREQNIFDDHDGHDDHDDHGHKDDDHDDHDDHDGHDDEHDGHDDHDDHGHKDDDHDDHDDHDGHYDEHDGHDDHDDHGHKDDDHDDHDDHDGHDDEHDGHDDHDEHAGHHDGHNHGEFDAHIWLDPANAKEMVLEISHELSELDPSNKSKYEDNASKTIVALDKLIEDVNKSLSKDISYIVFHDAYQYFEKRFGVIPAGALTLNPDVLPGAKQIADIQDVINDKGIKCIFSEPQYNPKIIETLGNDMNISTGVMDPLGAYIDAGPSMYSELINGIANSIKDCH
ncbi:zinc ABC transporter substrate-binding protein [Alphaproteobacteria bacterium]|nr:zinc ABC transporter substrate-binding protein [Alphaproteobacteria bacterium]